MDWNICTTSGWVFPSTDIPLISTITSPKTEGEGNSDEGTFLCWYFIYTSLLYISLESTYSFSCVTRISPLKCPFPLRCALAFLILAAPWTCSSSPLSSVYHSFPLYSRSSFTRSIVEQTWTATTTRSGGGCGFLSLWATATITPSHTHTNTRGAHSCWFLKTATRRWQDQKLKKTTLLDGFTPTIIRPSAIKLCPWQSWSCCYCLVKLRGQC